MPRVSKQSAATSREHGPVSEREEELAGYTVNFVQFHEDIDGTLLLKGLPDDRCQCPHWGYVLKGKMTMRFGNREEVYQTGDAFYSPPGHIPVRHEPGTEMVMFSPTPELRKTQLVMMENMKKMQPG